MRYLGIDYGSKRIGLALSDEEGRVAFPLHTIAAGSQLAERISALAQERGVHAIVIGHSLTLAGEANPVEEGAAKLAAALIKNGFTVLREDERLSTVEARRAENADMSLDAQAACIILNAYLARLQSR